MPRRRINWPRARTVAAWALLFGSLAGWPLSVFWWAPQEPVFVLSLSWLAIVIESASLLTSSQVRENLEDDSD